MRQPHDVGDGIDRPERVGDMGDGHDSRAIGEQSGVVIEQQLAAPVHRNDPQHGPPLLAHELPGDDVGMVLHGGHEHLVSRLEAGPPPARRDEVDAFGRAAHKDDLARRCGLEKRPGFLPRLLVLGGRALAQVVDAAVDVGVLRRVVALEAIDDRAGFLARGGVVEIDERLAVGGGGEDGEVRAQACGVEGAGRARSRCFPDARHAAPASASGTPRRCRICRSRRARAPGIATRSRISAPNP